MTAPRPRLRPPFSADVADEVTGRVLRSHDEAIREIQSTPLAGAVVVENVELEDGVATPVAHRLGKKPRWIGPSFVRGAATAAGYIVESRTGSHDRSQVAVLTANDFGATITVDVLAVP